jgi:carbamoyltransferase
MRILGINCGHDSSIGIVEDGRTTYAVQEERLSRDKFHRGFPFLSINSAFEYTGLGPSDFYTVVIANLNSQEEMLGGDPVTFCRRVNRPVSLGIRIASVPLSAADNLFRTTLRRRMARRMTIDALARMGFNPAKIKFVHHHLAHAAGAFFGSGFKEALIFTIDGKGDHVSHQTYIARNNNFEKLHESRDFDSPGFFYTCITAYLGFKRLQHEGKITGLAAYGDFEKVRHVPSPLGLAKDANSFLNLLIPDSHRANPYLAYLKMLRMQPALLLRLVAASGNIMSRYSQECFEAYYRGKFNGVEPRHVASFAQRHLENEVLKVVEKQVRQYKLPYICLSGGTFGNVRLNQKIAELDGVKSVYIQPGMGDGGLGVGAALWEYWGGQRQWNHAFMEKVYLGPDFSDDRIIEALKKYNLQYRKEDNIEKVIAAELVRGRIIGRYTGRMEWGPRALGNRTILAAATEAGINQTLNKRLKRTEFMPFAPIIMEEFAPEYFKNYSKGALAARFMTITYDVIEDKRGRIPAVVHVDGTARPQTVSNYDNPSLYKALSEYNKLTGIPVLINTSFNMHEEPIVCTPEDAIRAYLEGAVDNLAMENYWVFSR